MARAGIAVLAAALAAWFLRDELAGFGRPGFPMDDPYIHFQYARNLAHGAGFSFNPGEPSPGATSPLWVLLLALGNTLGVRAEWLALGLGMASMSAAAVLTFEVGLAAGLPLLPAIFAGTCTAACGRMVWAGLSGMETCLAAALSLLLVRAQMAEWRGWRRGILLGAVAGLAVAARPEMLILAAIVGSMEVLRSRPAANRHGAGTDALAYAATLIALLIPYALFCLATTGRPLPNTFYAKSLLPALDGILGQERSRYLPRMLAWAWQDNAIMAVLLVPGLVAWMWRHARERAGVVAWWPVAFWIYSMALYPRHFSMSRYSIPLIPFQFLLAMGAAEWIVTRLRGASARAVAGASLALALLPGGLRGFVLAHDIYLADVDTILSLQVETGDWVRAHLPSGARVATNDVGAITYLGGRYCIDTEGLISSRLVELHLRSRRVQPAPGREEVILEFLAEARPDYCIFFPEWYPAISSRPWLREVHRSEHHNTTGGGDHLVVYQVVDPPWK